MAYSEINNGIKRESTTHYHDLYRNIHRQLSAEDVRNTDTNDSAEEFSESPLDFSVKRKSKAYDEISGSESLSSPASSLNDTGNMLEDRKSDNDGGQSSNNSHQESPTLGSSLFHQKQIKNEQLSRLDMSPVQDRIGQPKTADPPGSRSPGNGQASMFNELQLGLANANLMASSFPHMAALMDPRRFPPVSKGSSRPFKAYPKDTLSMSLGSVGLPHYLSSFANFESSATIQGLNLSSEELFSIYKQQLMALRERDKYLEVLKLSQEQQLSRGTSTLTTTSPNNSSLPSSLSSMHLNNRNNGITNSIIGNIPNGPTSSQISQISSAESGSSSTSLESPSHNNLNQGPMTSSGRRRPRALPDEQKDDAYWERRRKNNEAAKRSRDARRAKEDEIAIRAALLEQENLKLRVEVAALKTETAKLRCMLYNS